jgi:hypothetical protein
MIERNAAMLLDLPIHPDTLLPAIGLLSDGTPVWPALGGADDDDDGPEIDLEGGGSQGSGGGRDILDDEDDEDEEDEHDDGADKAKGDEWKPPTREEWEKTQKALTEANAEAKKHRLRVRELRKSTRAAEQGGGQAGDEDAAAREQAALEAAEQKFKPVAIRSAAIAALMKADFRNPTEQRLNRMIRRLDMDELDVDTETGKVDGLEDQIDDLVDEFPELFGKDAEPEPAKPERRRAPRIDAGNKQPAPAQFKTTGERIAAQIHNSMR